MLCSVVMPLYNKGRFVDTALKSVLDQTYKNFEVIVIDDGSTDIGPARVRAVADDRIHLVRQANAGVACARNCGVERAKGDLVCFLDADDWYLPQYLETVVWMARLYPALMYFATSFKRISAHKIDQMTWDQGATTKIEVVVNLFERWHSSGGLFITNSVAVRRDFLRTFQPCFPPGESVGEDWDLWFRLAERSSLAYCPARLAGYRVELAGSLCSTYPRRSLLPVFTRLEKRAFKGQMAEDLKDSALRLIAKARVTTARHALIAGHRGDAFGHLRYAWRGAHSRRWWATGAMCLFATASLVRRWEHWRDRRARDW